MKKWSFSLLLGVAYLAVFHLWMVSPRQWIVLSGLGATAVLSSAFLRAWRRNYFLNRWDAVLHASVILDIFMEALFIPARDNHGFYLCALGFAVVLGGYRVWLARQKAAAASPG